MEDETLYISDPINCIYDEQTSKISIFKSIWYAFMQAEDICLKPESEQMELKKHYNLLSANKEDDNEVNQHSTSTATAQMPTRTQPGKKIVTNTKQSLKNRISKT